MSDVMIQILLCLTEVHKMIKSINQYCLNKYYLKLLVIIVISSFSINSWANQSSNSEVLRNTIIEIENQLNESHYKYSANQLNGLDAWVEDSEIKWSNSDISDFADQKLSFEVKLKNSEQIRAEQQILSSGQSKVDLKFTSLLEKRLTRTYLSLIDFIGQKQRRKLLKQQYNLTNSELNSWKLKVNSNDFRADKLQQVDLTLDSIWADELENSASLRRYENGSYRNYQSINHETRQQLEQSLNNVISIQQMLQITHGILQNKTYQQHSPLIRKVELGTVIVNKQNQRDNAREKLSLNTIKLEYDNKDNNFGFSVGIKMPITKNSYNSLLREQQQRNADIDAQYSVIEVSGQLTEKQFQLMQIQDQWISNQKLLHKINIRISRLSKTNNINLLLDLKQERMQRLMRQEEIQKRALKEYISFLNTAGMLSAKPYKNWIESGTPRIL